jgi:hypothetical protein
MNTLRTRSLRRGSRGVVVRAAVAGLTGTMLLSGCSMDWASMSPGVAPAKAEQESSRPVSAPVAQVVARTPGDLDSGSATHRLDAGGRSLVVDYWTTQDPAQWTADRGAAVQLSAHLEDSDDRHAVKVSRFNAVLDDGHTRTTLADDRGEFVVTPPYSYGSALTVPALPSSTTEATVAVQFDLLVETEPGSGSFFRQTVLDSVRLAFANSSNEVSK